MRILKSTKLVDKELKKFGVKEWSIANIEHYGKDVDYGNKEINYKAVDGGQIVGTIKGKLEAGILYIEYLIVAHDKKGQGVGKALMKKSEDFGKKNSAHKIHLITGKGWEAEKFYQALGYKQIALLPKHHFKKDFVIYEKFICAKK